MNSLLAWTTDSQTTWCWNLPRAYLLPTQVLTALNRILSCSLSRFHHSLQSLRPCLPNILCNRASDLIREIQCHDLVDLKENGYSCRRKRMVYPYCSSHPSDPCEPACHNLSKLEQVIYQWMAANGYAKFSQIPSYDMAGAADLPEDILDSRVGTYFAIEEEVPFDGASKKLYIAQRSTHRLGDLIDSHNRINKKSAKESGGPPAPVISHDPPSKRTTEVPPRCFDQRTSPTLDHRPHTQFTRPICTPNT